MRNKIPATILDVFLILCFLASLIRVPMNAQSFGDVSDLGRVIQQVQGLAKQADSVDLLHFQQAFQTAVQTMKTTAGLTTVVNGRAGKQRDAQTEVVVCLRIPYLLSAMLDLSERILCHSVSMVSPLMVDTSVVPSLDTPPPYSLGHLG